MIRALWVSLRPAQWAKNVFVLAAGEDPRHVRVLEADQFLHFPGEARAEAGLHKQVMELPHARGLLTVQFADREAVALDVVDHAGLGAEAETRDGAVAQVLVGELGRFKNHLDDRPAFVRRVNHLFDVGADEVEITRLERPHIEDHVDFASAVP